MDEQQIASVYARLGDAGFKQLVASFYRRVREDTLVGGMYPQDDWEGAEARLCGFLIQRFGGPPHYSQERGHPRLRMRHMPFTIDQEARDRWVEMMQEAMAETEVPDDLQAVMLAFFEHVASFLVNR